MTQPHLEIPEQEPLAARLAPQLLQLLTAYGDGDLAAFSALLPPDFVAGEYGAERFHKGSLQFRERFGPCLRLTFLTRLRRGHDTLLLWKGAFSSCEDELLLHLKIGGEERVEGFWIV
ncbi:hypothetical protein [Aeromonas diversa]|uniref:SnoaL-like domain-containing protein n=1 Tax=Aeromonas diversa CDC 2478-85 TaxID=1268237 RepID=N9VGP4_9GAMM|nr:hypothetical protein [Aeromonas diversa]ENY70566.1 hypothetical protein G114_17696 [Aeromonas diversa CDC 2478-85]